MSFVVRAASARDSRLGFNSFSRGCLPNSSGPFESLSYSDSAVLECHGHLQKMAEQNWGCLEPFGGHSSRRLHT